MANSAALADGFDQEDIGSAVDEAANTFGIVGHQLIEGDAPKPGVVNVRRDGSGFGGGPQNASDKTGLLRRPGFDCTGSFLGQFCPGKIKLVHQILHVIIRHRGSVRIKRIGLDDVRPSLEISLMNGTDDLRLGERKKIVISPEIVRKIGKACAAVVRFVELVALDHGSHRAIEQYDAACKKAFQQFGTGIFIHRKR